MIERAHLEEERSPPCVVELLWPRHRIHQPDRRQRSARDGGAGMRRQPACTCRGASPYRSRRETARAVGFLIGRSSPQLPEAVAARAPHYMIAGHGVASASSRARRVLGSRGAERHRACDRRPVLRIGGPCFFGERESISASAAGRRRGSAARSALSSRHILIREDGREERGEKEKEEEEEREKRERVGGE